MTDDKSIINELLNDKQYHIEFNGHLTNHVKHAVVALAGMNIPAQKIKDYYENYAKLTTYGFGLEPARASKYVISEENWKDFLGQRTSFSAYCDFFDLQVKKLGLDIVLEKYMPTLLSGWAGAFTHATIHLGWALDIKSHWMAVEGLAYMAYAYVSCNPQRAAITREQYTNEAPFDSLQRITAYWNNHSTELSDWVETLVSNTESDKAEGIHPELIRSGLQYRIAKLLKVGHPLIYELPAWLKSNDTSSVWDQLYYTVSLLYLAKPGDFVLLHLITSLHAMEKIAQHLPTEQTKDVIKCYWVGLLCILFSRADFPKHAKLESLHNTFNKAKDDIDNEAWKHVWEQTIARSVEEEEEHNPKLVYVLQLMWERSKGLSIYRAAAGQFTTTPELPPSFETPPTE
ncbi:questin oxidase family protein [Zooshikella marina]|uniref:questin oxidase family protein n=1 Tax=Zooshikella ganghwensis TaxID=202772 RepID=UPI001BAF8A5F|nr:questin oxidase family protein [Zooshikella ganghwensis]MBU2706131.1 questin oxidase family protein [Zooshikella ganghwensis]